MIKKRYLMIFAIAIAIFATFAPPKAIAGTVCDGDFRIELDSIRPGSYGGHIFKYLVSGGILPVSKFSILEFAIDASLIVDTDHYPKVSQHAPGDGGQNGWLKDCPQVSVVTITPQANTGIIPVEYEVFSSGGQDGPTGLWTKAGKQIDTCVIDGPVPGLSPYTSCPEHKVVQLAGIDYCIEMNPATCCPDPLNPVIYECNNPSNILIKDVDFKVGTDGNEEAPTIIQGFNDDPRCPVGKIGHNPCEWITLSGWPYGPICW